MNSNLEELASRALYAASTLERAIHDHGPWTMTWGPHEVPAIRALHDDGVTFESVFPEAGYLSPPETSAVLRCRGEVVAVRAIDHPGDAAFAITWALAAFDSVPVQ